MNKNEKETSLEELYVYLKRFSLSDSLLVFGLVNSVFKYNFNELYKKDIPSGTIKWIEDNFRDKKARVDLMLQLTRLARFLLLSGANDYRDIVLDTGTKELSVASSLCSSLFDKDVDGDIKNKRDLARVLGRIGQWQFPLQSNRAVLIGRAQLLFIDIPNEIRTTYNFDEKLKEYFGVNVFQFIVSGLASWILTAGVLKQQINIEIDALKDVITMDSINKFVELSSGTPEDYRRLVRGNDWKTMNKLQDVYGLDPFLCMPAVRITRSKIMNPGSYVVPQPFYLLQRASIGIFYLLGDKERELAKNSGRSEKNDFRVSFGDIYQIYVKKQLSQVSGSTILIDLDKDCSGEFKKPDFALIDGDICIVFEVKTAFLTVNSRTIFDAETTRVEIQQGNFKKAIDQLNSFEKALRNGLIKDVRFKKDLKLIKVIVGFEDVFLANAYILPLAREIYKEKANNLQIATLSDIEIIGVSLAYSDQPVKLIYEKNKNKDVDEWSLGNFIINKDKNATQKNPLLERAFKDFMKRATGKEFCGAI